MLYFDTILRGDLPCDPLGLAIAQFLSLGLREAIQGREITGKPLDLPEIRTMTLGAALYGLSHPSATQTVIIGKVKRHVPAARFKGTMNQVLEALGIGHF